MIAKRICVVLLLFATPIAALLGFACDETTGTGVPTDAAMTQYLQEHEADFSAVLAAFKSDPSIFDVTPGKVMDGSSQPITGPTADQLIGLYEKLELNYLIRSEGEVLMVRSPDDPYGDGPFKGYAFPDSPPASLTQTETDKASNGSDSVYRSLGDGWYIIYGQRG
jgi:hypothetical protein